MIINTTLIGVLLIFFVAGVLFGMGSKGLFEEIELDDRTTENSSVVDYRLKFLQDISVSVSAAIGVDIAPQEMVGSTEKEVTHLSLLPNGYDAVYDFYIHWRTKYFVCQVSYIGNSFYFTQHKRFRFFQSGVNKASLMKYIEKCAQKFEEQDKLSFEELIHSAKTLKETPSLDKLFDATYESLCLYNSKPSLHAAKTAIFLTAFCLENYKDKFIKYFQNNETPAEEEKIIENKDVIN